METRQQFISRMIWMIAEVKKSNYDDSNILSLLDFQLKHREINLINDSKEKVITKMNLKNNSVVTTSFVIKTGINEFLRIIKSL